MPTAFTYVASDPGSIYSNPTFGGSEEAWQWWQRELALILGLPGVTSSGWYGDVQMPVNLPSSETVKFFMRVLVHQYSTVEHEVSGEEFCDIDDEDVPAWYQFATGVLGGSQEDLLSIACRVLSSYGAGNYVYDLRKNREYPADWLGSGSGSYRSMMDRLFDRVHINHTPRTASTSGAVYRTATVSPGEEGTWWTGNFAPLTTYFATSSSSFDDTDQALQTVGTALGAFWSLVDRLSGSGSMELVGMEVGGLVGAPSSFAFPLDWRQAGTDGLFGGRLVLPDVVVETDDVTGKKTTFGEMVQHVLDKLNLEKLEFFLNSIVYDIVEGLNVAWLYGHDDAVEMLEEEAGIRGDFDDVDMDDVIEVLPDVLETAQRLREHLGEAVGETLGWPQEASASVYYLLLALGEIQGIIDLFKYCGAKGVSIHGFADGFLGEALGMGSAELKAFEAVFLPEMLDTPSGTEPYYPPVVSLGSPLHEHASDFNGFEPDDPELLEAGVPDASSYEMPSFLEAEVGGYAWQVWRVWSQVARPTLDAARVFDVAGMVAKQLVNVDDLQFATLREEEGSGAIADAIAQILIDQRIPDYLLPLGFTPGDVVGYLVRQLLTDIFIEYFARHEGADRETLHLLFSWMDTPDKRTNIKEALGVLQEVPLPPAIQMRMARAGWGFLPGRTAVDEAVSTVWVRSCMTPALGGGLGTLATYFLHPDTTDLEHPSDVHLGMAILALQAWTTDARDSDQAALDYRPDYQYTEANWVQYVREGVRQWELAGSPQSPLAGMEPWIDFAVMLPPVGRWLIEMPDASLSPAARAIKKAYGQAADARAAVEVPR